MTNFPVVFKEFSFFGASRRKLLKKVLFFSPLRGENCFKKMLNKKSHQNCLKTYLTFLGQKLLKKMFKNRFFLEELLKKLLNDFAASRRKLLKNPFLSNFSCLKKTLGIGMEDLYKRQEISDVQASLEYLLLNSWEPGNYYGQP